LSGCSIFSLEVWIRASFAGRSRPHAAAIPAPTNLVISSGMSMVASWASIGSLASAGGLPVGRFHWYRSSSLSSLLGGGEGEGDTTLRLGLGGEPPPLPPVPLAAGSGGSGGSGGGLEGGTTDRLCLRPGEIGVSRRGLRRAGRIGSGGGVVGAVAALVLGGLAGLRQSCRGSRDGGLIFGDPGTGIWVAIRRISSLAHRSSSSTLFIFLWWSAAHSSTLPWKVTRCWLRAVLASARKARVVFTRVS